MESKARPSEGVLSMAAYHPTVWRTCRILANPNRLRCLKAVLEEPDSSVGEIAARTGVSVCHASGYLRALQARGLLRASRESRWVRYAAVPDPLVEGTRPLLSALRQVLLAERQKEAAIIRTLTAFTHPRRLAVLCLLSARGPRYAEDIAAITRMSLSALSRHMNKLRLRGFALCDGGKWSLARPRDTLAKSLLALIVDAHSLHTSGSVQ